MEGSEPSESSFSKLPKERKTSFVLLLVFAIIGSVIGLLQLRNTLYSPFALNNKIPLSLKEQVVDNNIDYQKINDTDQDGLSDFDERYVYTTSPYLYDTFGYGMSDREVVQKGLPLCPGAGKNCSGTSSEGSSGSTANTSTVLGTLPAVDVFGLTEAEAVGAAPPDLNTILSDPNQIRQLLLQTGRVDQASLSKISDNDLLLIVGQFISSTSTQESFKNLSTSTFVSPTSTR